MSLEEKIKDVIARNWLNNWVLNEEDKKVVEEYLKSIEKTQKKS